MANINEIVCLGKDVNTGMSRCTSNPGIIKKFLAAPKGTYVTNTDMADPETFILGKIHNDDPAVRWYPSPEFVSIEVNNTEAGTQTFGYGNSIRVGTDRSVWTFVVIEGDQCGYDAIRNFHGQHGQYDFYFLDAQGQLMGNYRTVGGELRMYAYKFDDIYVPTWKPGDNSNTNDYRISFMFSDDSQLADYFAILQTGMDLDDIVGVTTANIELVGSVGSNGTVIVKITTKCGGVNMGDLYGSTLADAGAFILINGTTGVEIPLTSVSYNATLKQYTVDPDQSNGNYDVGEPAVLKFEPIADLVALGIAYYETPVGLTYTMN